MSNHVVTGMKDLKNRVLDHKGGAPDQERREVADLSDGSHEDRGELPQLQPQAFPPWSASCIGCSPRRGSTSPRSTARAVTTTTQSSLWRRNIINQAINMIMSGVIVAYVYDAELKRVATLEKEGRKVLTIDYICIGHGYILRSTAPATYSPPIRHKPPVD